MSSRIHRVIVVACPLLFRVQSGRTLAIITHDPAIAKRASRVVEIHDGRITSDMTA